MTRKARFSDGSAERPFPFMPQSMRKRHRLVETVRSGVRAVLVTLQGDRTAGTAGGGRVGLSCPCDRKSCHCDRFSCQPFRIFCQPSRHSRSPTCLFPPFGLFCVFARGASGWQGARLREHRTQDQWGCMALRSKPSTRRTGTEKPHTAPQRAAWGLEKGVVGVRLTCRT